MSVEFLLGLLLAIPLGIVGNLLTPKFLDSMAKRSISVRGERLKTFTKEYKYMKKLIKNPTQLALDMYFEIMRGISIILLLIIVFLGGSLLILATLAWSKLSLLQSALMLLVALVFMLISIILFNYIFRINSATRNLMKYDEYEKKLLTKITELGGNPEDLDKEETEGE